MDNCVTVHDTMGGKAMKTLLSLGMTMVMLVVGYAPSAAQEAPLIPREILFGNPDRVGPQISPDGKQLAFLAPSQNVLNVWVGPVDQIDKARAVTKSTKRPIRAYFWAYTNNQIVYIQDKDGDENWRVYVVDLATDSEKDITPGGRPEAPKPAAPGAPGGVQARIAAVSHKLPDEIVVAVNNRKRELHDLYRVNLRTGASTLVEQNDQDFIGYEIDDDYRVRLATKFNPDGSNEVFVKDGSGWKSFSKVPHEDTMTTTTLNFDKTGQVMYMLDSRGRDTAALTAVELKDGTSKVLFASDKADVQGLAAHPTDRTIQAARVNYLRSEWHVLDPSVKGDFEALKKFAKGEFFIVSRTTDDQMWLVSDVPDNGPVKYYRYDRKTKQPQFLFSNRKGLEGLPLAKMHPRVIKSRDGLELVSYLSLPVNVDEDGDGRPSKPLSMVLLVHGGPWGRDGWGYHGLHQWLANRGYAVLSVNFRGSTGFGKKFTNAGDLQWAAKMHDDLIDAVDWAIAEKIADPKKVAIMGGSYGGYATLVGLTFTPDKFACGVDIVGPSNLFTLINSIPPYWKPMVEVFKKRMGNPDTAEGKALLESRSPLTKVDQISRPLLIGQGANDPRVKQAESDQIVKAMSEKKIPVTYVLFADEGHGFARPDNSKAFNAITEAFLSKHLGGRYEPIGDDFDGSTVDVKTGVEDVPGLAEGLKRQAPTKSSPQAAGVR
jgi:dipeptidyl aminopeptidase/acylaminoacyl peptidase